MLELLAEVADTNKELAVGAGSFGAGILIRELFIAIMNRLKPDGGESCGNHGERLAVVETKLNGIEERFDRIESKLDELLSRKTK